MRSGKYQPENWWPNYSTAPRRWPSKKQRIRRTFRRLLIVLVILAVVLFLRQTSHPLGQQAREGLRYILTTEWNFQPVVQKVVEIGLRMVNVDHQFYGEAIPKAPKDKEVRTKEAMNPQVISAPIIVPVSGKVVRGFGWSLDFLDNLKRFHHGLDIAALPGAPVRAALSGQVTKVGRDAALGQYLILNHGEGTSTLYAGVTEIMVKVNQEVNAGEVIARIGEEGDVPGRGLHFELREKEKLIDPLTRLPLASDRPGSGQAGSPPYKPGLPEANPAK
ncbi:MAG: hypothetical protein STSR0004_09410 [Peptococcaceae bacterium]